MNALTINNNHYVSQSANVFNGQINTEKQFELAIDTANAGYKLKAMEIARETLIFSKQKNEYLAVYIHCFMAALCLEFKQYNNARIHVYNALNRIESKHYSYLTDKEYAETLLKVIEKAENGGKQLLMKELAA